MNGSNDQKGRYLMATTLRGVIRGKLIELEKEPGFTDGQTVAVEIRPLEDKQGAGARASQVPGVETWMDRLVFEPSILPGERVVKGTALPAEALVQELEAGTDGRGIAQSTSAAQLRTNSRWITAVRRRPACSQRSGVPSGDGETPAILLPDEDGGGRHATDHGVVDAPLAAAPAATP